MGSASARGDWLSQLWCFSRVDYPAADVEECLGGNGEYRVASAHSPNGWSISQGPIREAELQDMNLERQCQETA